MPQPEHHAPESLNAVEADLHTRWLPTNEQVQAGLAALRTVPEADRDRFLAVVPLALPGKQYGLWEMGQPVVPVPGVWLADNVAGDQPTAYSYTDAVVAAERAASFWLDANDLTGTVCNAVIRPDGHAAVFEGFHHRSDADGLSTRMQEDPDSE